MIYHLLLWRDGCSFPLSLFPFPQSNDWYGKVFSLWCKNVCNSLQSVLARAGVIFLRPWSLLSPSLKDVQATGKAFSLKREHPGLQNMKFLNFFLYFCRSFLPSRIRIRNQDPLTWLNRDPNHWWIPPPLLSPPLSTPTPFKTWKRSLFSWHPLHEPGRRGPQAWQERYRHCLVG